MMAARAVLEALPSERDVAGGRAVVAASDARTCLDLLKWALPRLGLAWPGYRRVHRQVCKRLARRMAALHVPDAAAYHAHLEAHAEEWPVFEAFFRIPISRFYRDRTVFDSLAADVMPVLAADALRCGRPRLLAWSAGCAAGEEPYSLNLMWKFALAARYPGLGFAVVATDADGPLLARARAAVYRASSLKELPSRWIEEAFERANALCRLKPAFQEGVAFHIDDLRASTLRGPFDLVLCRNLAFTYFDSDGQRAAEGRLFDALRPGGALVVGRHERLPGSTAFAPWSGANAIYRRPPAS
jgi:chemotaxis protein methyltransferase CheR